jgi:HlyD family secretion protein
MMPNTQKLRYLPIVLAIAGIIGSTSLVIYLRRPPPKAAPLVEPARNPYEDTIAASGIVEAASENIWIGIPSPGLVSALHVKVWDKVQKGQPLFELDTRELKAQLLVYEANVKTSQANLQKLEDQLKRLKSVRDPRAVSADEIQNRENEVQIAQSQLAAAESQVKQLDVLINRLTVTAPRNGTILQSNIREGEYAASTPQNPAMMLGDLDQLHVRAQVDEQNAPRVPKGPATAYLKGDTSFPIPLRFVRIEPVVVPKESLTGGSNERVDTRVLQIIYDFDQPKDRRIYVGQQVDVFIKIDPVK